MESAPSFDPMRSLSTDFKIKRSSTFHSKQPRLLDGLEYQHKYSDDHLRIKLMEYLSQKQYIETNLLEVLITAATNKTNKFIPKRAYDWLELVIEKIKCLPVLYHAITKNLEAFEGAESVSSNSSNLYQWDEASLETQRTKMFESFPNFDCDHFKEIAEGNSSLCASAVLITMNCIESIIDHIFTELEGLGKNNHEERYRSLLIYSIKLGYGFEFLFSSMLTDSSSIFYSDENREDIEILNNHLTVVNPEDLDKHLKKLEKAAKDIGFFIGIAQKGFQYKANSKKFMSLLYYTAFYGLKRKTGSSNGLLFQHTIDNATLSRMIQFPENKIVQRLMKVMLKKVGVDKQFWIPISKPDELTVSSYRSDSTPYIVQYKNGMNFSLNASSYNHDDFVKVTVISHQDWGKVDWKKGKCYDTTAEPAHVESIVLFIHGGGFISGSTTMYQPILMKMSKDTGFPVFSVDYRLAPDYPHPTPLSDCWMVYLWLQYYCREYFQLTFDKVILAGDSAGGNLCWGISYLSLLKNCKVPGGMLLIYPGITLWREQFFPSLLWSLDDPILNTAFLDFCIKSYDKENNGYQDFLLSPSVAPDDLHFQEGEVVFPPTRFLISGNDPLRDPSLLYVIRLAKLGVDVKAIDYQHQLHGFLMFSKAPLGFKESLQAVDKWIEFVAELGENKKDKRVQCQTS